MMKKKKITALFLAATMGISLTACGSKEQEPQKQETEDSEKKDKEVAAEENRDSIKIGLVLGTGGLGDKNFNDMAYAGITRAQEEMGIEFDYVEPGNSSDLLPLDRQFAESEEYDLIIAMAADQEEPIREIAEEFPEQKISLIDSSAEIEGVSTVQTEWPEQTFLAGVVAVLKVL